MNAWSFELISRLASGGAPGDMGPARGAPIHGAAIDSRAVLPGQIFVALKGRRTDGHRHVADAARAGAALAIVSDPGAVCPLPPADFPLIVVDDPVASLARLARAYRDSLERTLVVAVTGSAGKTTTTRLIASALGALGPGSHPARSFNNSIGVPLTILNARPTDAFLVCEVGTSAPGEIDALARIIRPEVGVITSIGRAHIEFLGSVEGVTREKSALLRHLRGPRPLALVPSPCDPLDPVVADIPHLRRFGRGARAEIRLGRVEMLPAGLRFQVESYAGADAWFVVPMLGEHNALNALAAVGVARHAGLTDDQIRRGLAIARGAPMRLERTRVNKIDIINDAYNANPESMRAAIDTLASLQIPPGARRVLVLGDMLELGDQSDAAHAEVMRYVASRGSSLGLVCALGPSMAHASAKAMLAVELAREQVFDDTAAHRIAALLRPDDVVLLKGSRGMRVERVADALAGQPGVPTA